MSSVNDDSPKWLKLIISILMMEKFNTLFNETSFLYIKIIINVYLNIKTDEEKKCVIINKQQLA